MKFDNSQASSSQVKFIRLLESIGYWKFLYLSQSDPIKRRLLY
jgi:hypothetical protein